MNLPESSYYLGIKDIIERQPDKVPMSISPQAFSADVVRQVERGTTGKYWIAGGSMVARFAIWIFPQWALVRVIITDIVRTLLTMKSRTGSITFRSPSQRSWRLITRNESKSDREHPGMPKLMHSGYSGGHTIYYTTVIQIMIVKILIDSERCQYAQSTNKIHPEEKS